jgi:hypothetical protein
VSELAKGEGNRKKYLKPFFSELADHHFPNVGLGILSHWQRATHTAVIKDRPYITGSRKDTY